MPVTAQKLDGVFTLVLDGDPVGKDKVILARTRICRLIFCLHCYLDSLGDFGYHRFKNINFLEFPGNNRNVTLNHLTVNFLISEFWPKTGRFAVFPPFPNLRAMEVKIAPSWKLRLDEE